MNIYQKLLVLPVLLSLAAMNIGCTGIKSEAKYPTRQAGDRDLVYSGERQGLFGTDGVGLFGGKDKNAAPTAGIGVNAFLWRASLDTINFMPIANADPFGGTILTDWYQPANTPNERMKVNLLILDRQLRADGIKASVFRQTKAANGTWQDAPTAPETARQLEDTILTRARQLRIAQAE